MRSKRCSNRCLVSLVGIFLFYAMTSITVAQEPAVETTKAAKAATTETANDGEPDAEQMEKLLAEFAETLNGCSLVGSFTMIKDGKKLKDGKLTEERYDIKSVKKLPRGDYWVIKARIRYGEHDLVVPVPVQVKWAGTKPVITLENVTVPGMGTFDAHVLINKDQYAGTWRHDAVGGHMFGRIEKTTDTPSPEKN